MEKQCRKCQEVKPISEYRKQSKSPDGLQRECKSCGDQRAKERYKNKRTEILAQTTEWAKNNKDKRQVIASKYNNTPSGRINSKINYALDRVLGVVRDTFPKIIGLNPSDFAIYLTGHLPEGLSWEDYGEKWVVGVLSHGEILTKEDLHWKNLMPRLKKDEKDMDFSI
jgi:hypothetical protein